MSPPQSDAAALGPGLSALSPAPALLVVTAVVLGLVTFPFAQLVEIDMSLYAVSVRRRSHLSPHRATATHLSHAPFPSMQVAMELLALITLRVTEPELHRPFRIPLRPPALALLCAPALAFCLGVVVLKEALQRPRHPHLLGLCHRRRRRRLVRRDLAGLGGEIRAGEEGVRGREDEEIFCP